VSYVDSFLAVLFLAFWHILCGRLPLIHTVRHSNWLSFSGGVAVAYVFESLLPKLGEWQGLILSQKQMKFGVTKLCEDLGMVEYCGGLPKFINYEIFLLTLAGLVFFLWIEWGLQSRKEEKSEQGAPSDRFHLHIGIFAAYNVLIGYITAHNILPGMFVQALLTIALALHFLGINHTLWIHYRDRFDNLGRWIFAGSLFFGWIVGVITEFAQTIYIAMYSFLAGAIIVSVFNDELPNRHEGQFWPFLSGVLIYSYLMMNFYSYTK
jgi:zinc transporter ZupT